MSVVSDIAPVNAWIGIARACWRRCECRRSCARTVFDPELVLLEGFYYA